MTSVDTARFQERKHACYVTPSDWDQVAWEKTRPEHGKLRAVKILHLLPPDGLHLDVGTGNGDGTLVMAQYKKTVGVEYGQKSLQLAADKGLLVYQADARDLPFESNLFSSLTCLDVLEHIQDPEIAVREMARVLKDGGILILQTPKKEEFKERLLLTVRRLGIIKQKQPYDSPLPHQTILQLLADAGFSILKESRTRYWADNPLDRLISISHLFYCRIRKS
ncbi:class I SAM-dependent methyltransferase [Geomonas nitrogeniifigens]|uniref:Class I SAM-dependent methyltransferase n=1 Tax=Geomonas diazotrophica TaxID=2843197 RepID=A0ABX8JFH5_9BACT|nr:class I SAM-dependent methyltransferase [Geomonas nitrogeniifigens]QWV95947.1 class I SAM-dependent methyltransferase [Geomonas nitrogeniifigens]